MSDLKRSPMTAEQVLRALRLEANSALKLEDDKAVPLAVVDARMLSDLLDRLSPALPTVPPRYSNPDPKLTVRQEIRAELQHARHRALPKVAKRRADLDSPTPAVIPSSSGHSDAGADGPSRGGDIPLRGGAAVGAGGQVDTRPVPARRAGPLDYARDSAEWFSD